MVFFDKEAYFPTELRFTVEVQTTCFGELVPAFPENIRQLEKVVKNVWALDKNSVFSKAFRKAFQYFHKSPTAEYRGTTVHMPALILERMHSSRMRTARSLTVSRRIPRTPPSPPRTPPRNHACPPQPCMPPATMHTPHNHTHPLQPHTPPPHNHAYPPDNHTRPPANTQAPLHNHA